MDPGEVRGAYIKRKKNRSLFLCPEKERITEIEIERFDEKKGRDMHV